MTKIHDITTYKVTFSDNFFFDTNVWMYIFCPIGNYKPHKQKIYSAFFNQLIRDKRTIFINSLILSEFANAYLKLDFNLWKDEPLNKSKQLNYKKDFIKTQQFKQTVVEVRKSINSILRVTQKCNDDFSSIKLENVLGSFGNIDFNDSYYIETAQKNKWKIVTDDSDFFNITSNIEVITANNNR